MIDLQVLHLYPHEWRYGDLVVTFHSNHSPRSLYEIQHIRSDGHIIGYSRRGVMQTWDSNLGDRARKWLVIRRDNK